MLSALQPSPSEPVFVQRPVRVLHLEDSLVDREIVRRVLVDDAFAFELIYAGIKAEFIDALESETFDLILSDCRLPDFDGASALVIARQKCPEVPYIFVSGTIGEEQAIESLKCGATDYVLKERLGRLVPAVRRALGEARERAKRRAAELQIRQAEARFRDIFEHAVVGIYEFTPEGGMVDVNHTMARLCGYTSPADFLANVQHLDSDLHAAPGARAELARLLMENGEVLDHESRIKRKDGTCIWVLENARAVYGTRGELLHYESVVTDITARKAAEDALRRSEERFREMAECIGDVFYIVAPDTGRWLYASPAYEQIWGNSIEGLYARPAQWTDAVVPQDRALAITAHTELARGREFRIEYRIRRPDGTLRHIEDRSYLIYGPSGETIRVVGVATDITRRRQLEAQFLEAQKMEVVGQLAGGVAHDFNNILLVIMGCGEWIASELKADDPLRKCTDDIRLAVDRAAGLTQQLLFFSRKETVKPVVLDLNDVVKDLNKMLRRLIDENIELTITPGKPLGRIKADSGYIGQVLMNLIVNARDAMPQGGKLSITTANETVDESHVRLHRGAVPGDYVVIQVTDTGAGMTDEVKARLFEAFFTTKPKGKGTGLGLATCQAIVKQSGGFIALASELGKGTTFKIYFPRVEQEISVAARTNPAKPVSRGSETLLVVEDEPSVRNLARAVLQAQGYTVLSATNGQDALQVARLHQGAPIRLVISDVIMPQMGGKVMAEWLKTTYPDLKVLFTSGYTDDALAQHGVLAPGIAFLPKPYTGDTLNRKVREMLDENNEAAVPL